MMYFQNFSLFFPVFHLMVYLSYLFSTKLAFIMNYLSSPTSFFHVKKQSISTFISKTDCFFSSFKQEIFLDTFPVI